MRRESWWLLLIGAVAIVAYEILKSRAGGGGNNDLLSQWALAIQKHEGWFQGSQSYRNNNPGNIKGIGDAGTDAKGFAVFSNYDAGFNALVNDLSAKVSKYPNYSILQIMTRYLGGDPNNPQVTNQGDPFAYAQAVASELGVGISDTLKKVFG